ncbi:unnamed protein product, partial [Scytosiphon promiscuus]
MRTPALGGKGGKGGTVEGAAGGGRRNGGAACRLKRKDGRKIVVDLRRFLFCSCARRALRVASHLKWSSGFHDRTCALVSLRVMKVRAVVRLQLQWQGLTPLRRQISAFCQKFLRR